MNRISKENDFPYIYRFNDANYNKLPKEDLLKITLVNNEESSSLWEKHMKDSSTHFKMIDIKRERLEKTINDCGWGDKSKEEETRKIFKEMTDENTNVAIFWSKHYAVRTTWGIFCKYWSDFCYPSDDGNIIIYDNNIIIYDEDKLYKMKDDDSNFAV